MGGGMAMLKRLSALQKLHRIVQTHESSATVLRHDSDEDDGDKAPARA
jgi:hypothetical protein